MFSKYDCAFLKSDAGDEPYVVRIEDMWEDLKGQMLFLGVCVCSRGGEGGGGGVGEDRNSKTFKLAASSTRP